MRFAFDMWTGEELQHYLSNWDFSYKGYFTQAERRLMTRAAYGDFNWMYDKHGNPRTGWIILWDNRADQILAQYQKANRKDERSTKRRIKRANRDNMPKGGTLDQLMSGLLK